MGLFDSLFRKKPEDYIAKGEKYLADDRFYEAKSAFEEGLSQKTSDPLASQFVELIKKADKGLAELNINEALRYQNEHNMPKAIEHLKLAKTLSSDTLIREKADKILSEIEKNSNDKEELETISSCSSCSSCSPSAPSESLNVQNFDADLDPEVHYELLIHQLPPEICSRYANLGEDFAYMYIAASFDEHQKALSLLEKWEKSENDRDIYFCERGKILHRLGDDKSAEASFKEAINLNPSNPLPFIGLALLLIENVRFEEADELLQFMISKDILAGQSIMLRGEVFQMTGRLDEALEIFASMLKTGFSKNAAEKIYEILIFQGRENEAKAVRKQYLSSCH